MTNPILLVWHYSHMECEALVGSAIGTPRAFDHTMAQYLIITCYNSLCHQLKVEVVMLLDAMHCGTI